jgi:hypothetical protein
VAAYFGVRWREGVDSGFWYDEDEELERDEKKV